jgi:lipopolysaccharide transport system ATP-binding protein
VSDIAISIERLSKFYRLGTIGNRTLYQDLNRAWARMRGRPDPITRIGERGIDGEGLWALRDVDFKIKHGEVLGIIGRNGAGKSTLLKILSRVTGPTSGEIKVRGRLASLLEVGTGFHPDLTGRENIYLNGAILGMTRGEVRRKFDAIVAFADVEKFIDTPVKRYSSGMYVRLAFAVAAHLDPEILVIDEVLAVGDQAFQEKCLGKMSEISRAGRTVLFVSHNLQSVWSLCPNSIWLDRGTLRAAGSSSEVIDLYRSSTKSTDGLAADIIERAGSGRVRISDVGFEQRGESVASVPAGGAVDVALSYAAQADTRLDHLQVYIVVLDDRNMRLFSCSNAFSGHRFGNLSATGKIVCRIPRLPLVPGEYEILISVTLGQESVDKFVLPRRLVVSEGAFFAGGTMPSKSFGSVLVDHQWEVRAS